MTLRDIKPYKKLPFHGVILPTIAITPEQKTAAEAPLDCDNPAFLKQLCREGFKKKIRGRVPADKEKAYAKQVNEELDVIKLLGFTDYILMVWDICEFADQQKIPRGPGRGSVAGSLVAHLVGISALDPVENGLFFTRFLSKARAKSKLVDGVRYIEGSLVPDIDCDFSYYRRGEIIEYLNRRYPGQTAKLLTTTTFTSKILIKDVLKSFENGTEEQANEASGLLDKNAGIPQDLEVALYGDKKWQEERAKHPTLAAHELEGEAPNERFVKWAAAHKETVAVALGLSDLNRGEGQHASAVLIAHKKITELLPLQLSSSKESVSAFEMQSAQELVIKMDILGLRTLDVIQECCALTGIDRESIDIHDPGIYAEMQDFRHRYGIFQLETFAQGNAAAKIKPVNFEQLTAVLAIARPGAIAYLDQYCAYIHEGKYNSVHPLIDDILKPTGGVCLYQEQYLAMLVRIGMTPEEAENARRVLGKKKVEEVPIIQKQISEICARNGHATAAGPINSLGELVPGMVSQAQVAVQAKLGIEELLLKIAKDSGGYSFNLSHAASYAMITAWTLFLKTKTPLPFYLSLLRMARHESAPHEVVQQIEQEMRVKSFSLLPPHFVQSSMNFQITGEREIRYALGLVRGVSDKTAEKLELFRGNAKGATNTFEVFQALRNAALSVGIGAALIQAGCMEGYDAYTAKDGRAYQSRSRLVLELLTWNLLTDTEKGHMLTAGGKFDWDVLDTIKHLAEEAKNLKGKPIISEKRFATIKKNYEPYKAIYQQNARNERLANYYYERRVLGYSYSETIADIFSEYIEGLVTVEAAKKLPEGTVCRLIGFVAEEPRKGKTQKGNSEYKLVLRDETGDIVVKAFNERIETIEQDNGRLCEEDDLVIANVKKMNGNTCFLQRGPDGGVLGIQTCKIYFRLQDLKDTAAAKEARRIAESPEPSPKPETSSPTPEKVAA